jgi:CubicO group peptidase (beta-lactamase class C family)
LTEAERNDKLERMSIGSLLELPSHFPNRINLKNFQSLDQPFLNINKGDLIGYYSNFRPAFSSVNKTYGDTDYAIWQVLVEKALGQDFQMIIDTYLNQLLGSEIFFTQFEFKNEGIAKGLTRGGQVGSPYMLDGYGAGNGLKACLTDLLAFLRFRIDSTPDLTKVEKNLVSAWSKDVKGYKGMYLVKPKKKVFVISTNGTSNIHSSFLAYVPATKTGIVILSNGASGTKDLGMLILRMINNNWKRNKS